MSSDVTERENLGTRLGKRQNLEAKFAKILAWDAVFGKKTLFGREVTEILVIK